MKKLSGIIAFLLLMGIQVKAQKEVLFKIKYLPHHTYSSIMKMDMNMQLDVSGDTAAVNKIKKSGESMPVLIQVKMDMNMDVKTAAINTSKDIPLTMNMSISGAKMSMNGKEQPAPSSDIIKEKFFGKYTKDGKFDIDSVSGMKLTDSAKNVLMEKIKNMQANIIFPDKPMKVGDTFVQSMPIDVPGAGSGMKMLGKTTYKLLGIENSKAYFDVNMVITMDMTEKGMTMDMTGGGSGKMIFDIASSYPSTIQNNIKVSYSMDMPQQKNMKMQGKMNMLMDMQTTVSAN